MDSASVLTSIRASVREAIRDDYGLLWTDAELDGIILEAQREYSIHACTLTGSVDVTSNEENVYDAPPDFIEPLKFHDFHGIEIPFLSWEKLNNMYPDFRKIPGTEPQGVCFDFDGYGRFRTFPKIPAGKYLGKLTYRRLADPLAIEAKNLDAVEQHALFQMFLFTSKTSAVNYERGFFEAVNSEARSNHTLRNRSHHKRGSFF